jgi:hypothetical protein
MVAAGAEHRPRRSPADLHEGSRTPLKTVGSGLARPRRGVPTVDAYRADRDSFATARRALGSVTSRDSAVLAAGVLAYEDDPVPAVESRYFIA